MATTVSVADFRVVFPEFANTTTYPDARVQFFLDLASENVNVCVFGNQFSYAVYLFAAHYLTLAQRNASAAAAGGVGGGIVGADTSQTVHDVSYTFDAGSITEGTPGYWAQTSYGVAYYDLIRRFGKGPVQVHGIPPTGFDNEVIGQIYGLGWYC